jgi:gas vesicle protein
MATKKMGLKTKAGVGIAAVAAAATAYYFFGKDGKQHRKDATVWVGKAKKEAASELKQLKSMTLSNYTKTVKGVTARYKKFQKEYPEEFKALAEEFKDAGQLIMKRLADESKPKAVAKVKRSVATKTKK